MCGITLFRPDPGLLSPDSLRSYQIFIDGVKVAKVRRGETVNLEVARGTHEVYAKIDWKQSPVCRVEVGDLDLKLKVESASSLALAPLMIASKKNWLQVSVI